MQWKRPNDAILMLRQTMLVGKKMVENQQNQNKCASAVRRLLPLSYLTLLAFSACGEAPSDPPDLAPVTTTIDEAQTSAGSVIEFSFGGEQLEFLIGMCRITPGIVIIQGKNGESVLDLLHDGRPKVNYQHHFERDGVRFWDQWDSKRDDIEYSVDGSTVTASGTMGNTNRWREGTNDGWENVTGSDAHGDQPFTFSVTCN
jgi:hypothetical protein